MNAVKIRRLKLRKIVIAMFSATLIFICTAVLFDSFKKSRIEYRLEECLCGHYDLIREEETTKIDSSSVSRVLIVSTLNDTDIDRLLRYMRVQELVFEGELVIEEVLLAWDDLLDLFVEVGLVSSRQQFSHYTVYAVRDPVDDTSRRVLVEKSTNRVFIDCSGI